MGTQESGKAVVIDTMLELGKDSKYVIAKIMPSEILPQTSTESSKTFAVRSSIISGSVSIRTIPTTVKCFSEEDSTT